MATRLYCQPDLVSPADRQLNIIARLNAEEEGIITLVNTCCSCFAVSSPGMSELGQLDTYYRIVYDYLQPDRLLSCVEGVLLSVVGVSSHQEQSPQQDNNNDDDDDSVVHSAERASSSSFSSGQLWCVASTVQSRVLLALILYFCLCLFLIHIAWLVYGQHINDLFVRSGIGQPQQQPQQVNHGGNPVKSSPKHQTKID